VLPALVLGAALTWGTGLADPPAKSAGPQPDAEFLEFLGSVDSASETDDGSWMEYLAQADIDKAAKKASPPAQSAKPAPRDDRPASTPAEKLGSDAKQGASKVKPDGQ